MSANITIKFQWPGGMSSDVYTISDDDAQRLLDAYTALFAQTDRPGAGGPGGPRGRGMQQPAPPPVDPTTEETLSKMANLMFRHLTLNADRYHQQTAARDAALAIPPINAIVEPGR